MKKMYTTFVIALVSINTFSQAPSWEWAKSSTGSSSELGKSIATDIFGNIYITGYFLNTTVTFGSYSLTNSGSWDMFIVKYNSIGTVLWAKSAGGSGDDRGNSIATDSSGNILVTGYFSSSTITFGTTVLTNMGNSDIFIAKYNPVGNVFWAKSIGFSGDESGNSVITDLNGNVFITGNFSSATINFGTTLLSNLGSNDIFVAKYDSNGNGLWAKSAGGSSYEWGSSIATDINGNVLITGVFHSASIYFDTTQFMNSSVSSNDIFIAKYDTYGNRIWTKKAGGNADEFAYSITTDIYGNIFVTGSFVSNTLIFGSTILTNSGSSDVFTVKYSTLGNVQWAKSAVGSLGDEGFSITTDIGGNAFLTGYFNSTNIIFGTITLTNLANDQVFIVKYDSLGNTIWAKKVGGSGDDSGNGITTDVNGSIIIVSQYYSNSISVAFDTILLTNSGGWDTFVAKLGSSTSVNTSEIQENQLNIKISPNPFTSQATISFSEEQINTVIKITGVLGNEIKTINFTGRQLTIEKGNIQAGIYFVKTTDEKKSVTNKKIIIQ